ncbi:GHKL domain-containing protein [Nocardioides sp. MAH-18]|uniref:histidine kinase n=1 Tax=Nocardioides agri TaxID=2682843 RepID=A0A6L6XMR1_9ACTN|nr:MULTISPECIES: ATP-binding protein [unclassified Nocardioides]MBA2953154.1 Spo0B domain-containing protein [Nocardioides sp. CGMCC 1.13656]MVQ48023.1 GHKL domain-containing protein [Nocardioides sp. MAH-18]
MWSRPRLPRPRTLAGQFLALQAVLLLLVVAVTSVVSFRQSDADFRDSRGARLRASAENLASTQPVQVGVGNGSQQRALTFYAQQRQDDTGATAVHLVGPGDSIVVSTDPTRVGDEIDLGPGVSDGRAWTGDLDDRGQRAIAAEVPIIGIQRGVDAGEVVGAVVVTERYPSLAERLRQTLPDLLSFLAVGLTLGLVGAWLLARLIKRRTRGLEPAEIADLADQREALLTSLREGVLAVNESGTVTLLSESARALLDLPPDSQGRLLADLDLPLRVLELLIGDDDVHDAVAVVGGRVLVLNSNRVVQNGRPAGTVTTLRDRTELLALQSQLSARESVTETLRAQTHEFANQLHTISGLLELEEYDEAGRLIGTLTRRRAAISDFVLERVEDPAVAAMLVAKTSLAAERRVELALSPDSRLPRLAPDLSADLGTVLGNLVDNAVDAAAGADAARVDVRLTSDGGDAVVQVADSGPGVPGERIDDIFERGFSTKPSDASGRGVGLALVQVVCERRGGSVSVHNDDGAVFTARLPMTEDHG